MATNLPHFGVYIPLHCDSAFFSSRENLFLSLLQHVLAPWPTEYGSNDVIQVPKLGLHYVLKILPLPSWNDALIALFRKAGIVYWKMRGHIKENEDSPAIVNSDHETQEWGGFEPLNSDNPPAWIITWSHQMNIPVNPQNYTESKKPLLLKSLGFRMAKYEIVN